GLQLANVFGRMHATHVFIGGRLWREKILVERGNAAGEKPVPYKAIFLRGEHVSAEIQVIAISVNQFERQHGRSGYRRASARAIPSRSRARLRPSKESGCICDTLSANAARVPA